MSAKSIHRPEYQVLLTLLKEMRDQSKVHQTDLAAALGRPQSFISNVESGTRRLDLLQLREYCLACGQDLVPFVEKFEKAVVDGKL